MGQTLPQPRVEAPVAAPLAPVARVSTVDRWLDLMAQRVSASHFREDRLLIDLGSLTSRKYLQLSQSSPWRLGEDIGGRRAGILVGQGGSLDIPVDGPLSPPLHPEVDGVPQLAMAITLRALAPKQRVTVLWEERPLANLSLSGRWERRTFSLPPDLVHAGENQLRLYFRSVAEVGSIRAAAAVESIEIASRDTIVAGPPESLRGYVIEPGSNGDVEMTLPAGSSLVYYVDMPRRARLHLQASGNAQLQVFASTDADHQKGVTPKSVLSARLRPRMRTIYADVTGYSGVPTRLEIRASGRGVARFRTLEIIARRAVPVDRRSRTLRDVYVFAVEGIRADSLAAARSPRLPAIERFFGDALVFERAYALGAAAVPSHAGWMSSVVPPSHLTVRGTFVAGRQTLLAEALDRVGYKTVGLTANTYLNEERGLTDGFDVFRAFARATSERSAATAIVDTLLSQLESSAGPQLGFVNLNDPQAPFVPPRSLIEDIEVPPDAPARHLTHMWVGRVRLGKHEPNAKELVYVRRLYRGELQVIDEALAKMLEGLSRAERLEDSIVVFLGIHGEEFFEHQGAGHGRTLYDESLRVPLAIRAPHLLAPGRVSAPVDLLDVTPTLADLLGLEYASTWQGESLVPLIDDPQPPPRLVVSHLGDGSRAAVVGGHKLIMGPGRGRGAQKYFALASDPTERSDLVAAGGIGLRVVRNALCWHLWREATWRRARWGTGASLRAAFAQDHGL